jgi:hypothetical protein
VASSKINLFDNCKTEKKNSCEVHSIDYPSGMGWGMDQAAVEIN